MATAKNRNDFTETEEGKAIIERLKQLAESSTYNTIATYSSDAVSYPDNLIPFVDKHVNYLIKHPSVDVNQYLANIKLMTLVR